MSDKYVDSIGNSPVSTLPLGVATLGTAVEGWIGYHDWPDSLDVESGDAWALDLIAGTEYTVVYEVTEDANFSGDYDTIEFIIAVSDLTQTNDERTVHQLVGTDDDDPVKEFTFTATETNTYYFHVLAGFSGDPQTTSYKFVVTETGSDDPDDLPDLVAPDANSLETALYHGNRTDGLNITYWFVPDGEDNSDGWDATEQAAALAAMEKWAAVANITFSEAATKADADWLLVTKDNYANLGSMHFPGDGQQTATFNKTHATWAHTGGQTGLSEGGNGFLTLLHEFGHGLGLAHPHKTEGQSTKLPGANAAFGDYGQYNLNQTLYSVMSYNTGFTDYRIGTPDPVNWGYPLGPSAIDIAVVQRLYGARDANTGDDIYDLVDTNTTGTGFQTIWDTGGTDWIRGVGDKPVVIDLRAATLLHEKGGGGWPSFKKGIAGGFTIANSVVIENAKGGSKKDTLIGNDVANRLLGEGGKDILKGNGGNDILRGGAQNDKLFGGLGDDILNGEGGKDTADYSEAKAAITVDMATNQVTGEGTDTLVSIERVIGTKFADTMTAGDKSVLLIGGKGRDTITGGSAKDRLQGGEGRDVLKGNGKKDILFGNDGKDILIGGDGNDILVGGADRDGMRGGAGNDTFVFRELSDSGDTRKEFDLIKGFSDGDKIDLSRLDALPGGGDDAFTFLGTERFTGDGGELRIVVKGSKTFALADVDGDKKIDFGIEFRNADLDAGDFIL